MKLKKGKDLITAGPGVSQVEISMSPFGEGVIAVYFRLSDRPVHKTVESEVPDVIVDLDNSGEVVGLEVINPQTRPLKSVLKKISRSYKGDQVRKFQEENADRLSKLEALVQA